MDGVTEAVPILTRMMRKPPVARRAGAAWVRIDVPPPTRGITTFAAEVVYAGMHALEAVGQQPKAWMFDGKAVWVR